MFQLPLLSLFAPRPRSVAAAPARPDRREPYALEVAGLVATVTRKPMRSLRLRLAPPDGRLLVSAPLRCSDKAICEFLAERRGWIEKHQQRMLKAAASAAPALQYADGERLSVLGSSVTLRVLAQGQRARARRLENGDLLLTAPAGASLALRRKAVQRWMAQALLEAAEALRPQREAELGVQAAGLKVRAMRSRWGSCNTRSHLITLSLTLAERNLESLDYILVHELAHLIVRSHGPRFQAIVQRHVPDWKARRKALNGTDATE